MATNSSILAWKTPCTEEPVGLWSMGVTRNWTTEATEHSANQHQGFPGGSVVKNLPAMQETQEMQVQFLGQEDPLEKGMAIHSNILA